MATAKKAVKKTAPKKEISQGGKLKAGPEPLKLKDGMYFTAVYKDGKKYIPIRGVVDSGYSYNYNNSFLLWNKLVGENGGQNDDYSRFIKVSFEDDENVVDVLEAESILEFKEVTSKKEKLLILQDQNPEIAGFPAQLRDDSIEFGCGAIELSLSEIEDYLKIRKEMDKVVNKFPKAKLAYKDITDALRKEEISEFDFSSAEIEQLLTWAKSR